MRVVIWVDMEGIAGIENWDQVSSGKPQYEEGRRLLTGEVNAAVRGAKAGGADDIIVIDCHGAGGSDSFRSLIPERLERGASYVLGTRLVPLCRAAQGKLRCRAARGRACHGWNSRWRDVPYLDTPHGLKPDGFSVLRRGQRHASPKALPEPLYILRGVVVAMQAGSALRAGMPADR